MFQAVWGKWNRIDALCANAGVVDRGSLYILDERGSGEYKPPSPQELKAIHTDLNAVKDSSSPRSSVHRHCLQRSRVWDKARNTLYAKESHSWRHYRSNR